MKSLGKGENLPLTGFDLRVELGWDATDGQPDLDLCALLVGESGRVREDADFVFFNQPRHPSGAVVCKDRETTSTRARERMAVDLRLVPVEVQRVVLVASSNGTPFARVRGAQVTLSAGGSPVAEHRLLPEGSETCLVLAELYRRGEGWKVRAVSQGYAAGLAGLATDYGVDVEGEPAPAAVPVTAPAASAVPAPASAPGPASTSVPSVGTAPAAAASAAPAPPPRPAPRGDRATPSVPALRTAADKWSEIVGAGMLRDATRLAAEAIAAADQAFRDAQPSIADELRAIDQMVRRVEQAWLERFRKHQFPAKPGSEPWTEDANGHLSGWLEEAAALVAELDSNRVALTSNGRVQYRNRQAVAYRALMEQVGRLKLSLRQSAHAVMAADGPTAGTAAAGRVLRTLRPVPAPPAPIGPFARPIAPAGLPTGIGPVLVSLGTATPSVLHLKSTWPGTNRDRTHTVALPPVPLPLVLDLDQWGGFVCNAHVAVEQVITQLLAALPAGQLQLRVFDPERLGESANFLYGLGDAAERIIGQKVKTTPKELADLLVETEEHITFVTQKYLQGSFDSLTAYNLASGDVAEPYRMLVLYDYPSAFTRDASYDTENVDRLAKIVSAGRRCGVFTVVVGTPAGVDRLPQAVRELPWFFGDHIQTAVVHAAVARDEQVTRALYASRHSSDSRVAWRWQPPGASAVAVRDSVLAHVERGLRTSGDIQVDPARVAELATAETVRAAQRGTQAQRAVADPFDPATWWRSESLDVISSLVGRQGAADVARVELDSKTASSALVGGRPGSGKSVLLHAMILSLVQEYGPDELELYLVDFKEGVEFKQYATHHLPHARVVAIESEREFGVSVLQSLAAEVVRRGQLFRDAGSGEETNLEHYRRRTGRPLPRVLLVADEFQVLFDRDDKLGAQAAELLERVLRTGRAFGVHVVLASQTIAGMPALGRHLPNLIPTRVALQVADADSRLLLSEDNADAKLLSRPGEGILNTKGGLRDANQRFQATYWSPEQRGWALETLAGLAVERGHTRRPVVFEGQQAAHVDDVDPAALNLQVGKSLELPLGAPMTLGGPVRAELRREPGGNLLYLHEDPGALGVVLGCLAAAQVETTVLDFGGGEDAWAELIARCEVAPSLAVVRRRDAATSLAELIKLVEERHALRDYAAPPRLVVVTGLHRAREIEPSAEYDDDSEAARLKRLLRDGPEVGIHVVAWVDKRMSLERRLSGESLREFGLRVVGPMGREDSLMMIDTDDAAGLRPGQGVLDDHDTGRRSRVRLFAQPDPAWLEARLGGGSST